jgi:hypothetical protein
LELEGLFSEGNLGLEQALEKFDPTKTIDFLPMLIGGFADMEKLEKVMPSVFDLFQPAHRSIA